MTSPMVPMVLGPATPPLLHVMGFNLRCIVPGTTSGDPDHWPLRAPAIAALLDAERPDLLGVQEATLAHLDVVVSALDAATGTRHDVVGTGREGGSAGEYAAIVVDRARLDLLEWTQFWLSETPGAVGSRGWGCETPRIVTMARVRDRATGRRLVHANTHLDWVSAEVRRHEGQLIGVRVPAWAGDDPVVMTGDFNSDPRTEPLQATLCADAGWHDVALQAGADPTVDTSSWYGHPEYPEARIDWILGSREVTGVAQAVNRGRPGGAYPSDHWPVQVHLALR